MRPALLLALSLFLFLKLYCSVVFAEPSSYGVVINQLFQRVQSYQATYESAHIIYRYTYVFLPGKIHLRLGTQSLQWRVSITAISTWIFMEMKLWWDTKVFCTVLLISTPQTFLRHEFSIPDTNFYVTGYFFLISKNGKISFFRVTAGWFKCC